MAFEKFTMRLVEAHTIAPGVKHFMFEREDKQNLNFIPGQFITIHIPFEDKIIRRSYSIASLPGSPYIEFAASYVEGGLASELLFNLAVGDGLETTGAFGRLILKDEHPARYILVATGTGVTPYRAMLSQINDIMAHTELQVVLLFGVRNAEDLLYADEFRAFAKTHPQFDFRAHLSREDNPDATAHLYPGYVQSAFPTLSLNPEQDVVYLCGNPAMVDDAFTQLKDLGFDTQSVRREKYISGK